LCSPNVIITSSSAHSTHLHVSCSLPCVFSGFSLVPFVPQSPPPLISLLRFLFSVPLTFHPLFRLFDILSHFQFRFIRPSIPMHFLLFVWSVQQALKFFYSPFISNSRDSPLLIFPTSPSFNCPLQTLLRALYTFFLLPIVAPFFCFRPTIADHGVRTPTNTLFFISDDLALYRGCINTISSPFPLSFVMHFYLSMPFLQNIPPPFLISYF